jgi:GT2 family glycosyltransferase
MSSAMTELREIATDQASVRLREFLRAGDWLHLPRPGRPRLSILLVLYNRAELTLACLRSLQPHLREADAEIVLVDNASGDETPALLDQLHGPTVIRNDENRGFPVAVNQAAAAATGEFLLLLNNDTEVLGDSLGVALRFLSEHPGVGAVGGQLLLLDDTLQEAGCTVWREGHVLQYGRGDPPAAPEYQFCRDVDYCSAAFLMTRRDLFRQLGGLDIDFSPGYFEDADYGIRLWRGGWRVVYVPEITVRHHENASSTCRQHLQRIYHRNHALFTHKHADWLPWKRPAPRTAPLWARSSHDDRFRILVLPIRGSSGSDTLLHRLRALYCFVTVYPIDIAQQGSPGPMAKYPRDVEVLEGGRLDTLPGLLAQRHGYYDCILASDPEVLEQIRRWKEQGSGKARDA